MVKDGMKDKLLTVNQDYLSFADRIFNKYKDLYTKQHEDLGNHVRNNQFDITFKKHDEFGNILGKNKIIKLNHY